MSKIYLKAKNKKSGNQSIEFEGADISVVRRLAASGGRMQTSAFAWALRPLPASSDALVVPRRAPPVAPRRASATRTMCTASRLTEACWRA